MRNAWVFLILSVLLINNISTYILREYVEGHWPYRSLIQDFGSFIVLSFLFAFAKRRSLALFSFTLVLLFAMFSQSLKIITWQTPIFASELGLWRESLQVLSPVQFWFSVGVFVLFLAVSIYNFQFDKRKVKFALPLIATMGFVFVWPSGFHSVSSALFKNIPWAPSLEYQANGPISFLLHDMARMRAEKTVAPTEEKQAIAKQLLQKTAEELPSLPEPPMQSKNVYILLMESWFDPTTSLKIELNRDPLEPLRPWIDKAQSTSMVHASGGGTANTEFELFCGFPPFRNGVIFLSDLNDNSPCLPRIVQEKNWEFYAFHANNRGYYRRSQAFPRIGIEKYFDADSYDMSEPNPGSQFIPDETFYNQSKDLIAKIQRSSSKRQVHYLLSSMTHSPYFLNANKYPPIIHSQFKNEAFDRYLNTLYYSSLAAHEFVQDILKQDPWAQFVILGDHLPGVVNEVPLFDADDIRKSRETPLLVLDGKGDGTLQVHKLGKLWLYQVTHVLLERWGMKSPLNTGSRQWRLVRGQIYLESQNSLCQGSQDSTSECQLFSPEFEAMKVLFEDAFFGDGHSL